MSYITEAQEKARETMLGSLLKDETVTPEVVMNKIVTTTIQDTLKKVAEGMGEEQNVPPVTADPVYHGDCIGHNTLHRKVTETLTLLGLETK